MLPRLLVLSLTVATLAVVATALLATYGTGAQARDELAGDASLLETDGDILDSLYTYANEHAAWDGVETLVRELAERTGRRITLVTPDGETVADSTGDGLPSVPSARIDAALPPADDVTARPNVVVWEPGLGVRLGFYGWQLTERELRLRQALADEAVDCLRRTGARAGSKRTRHHTVASSTPAPPNPCVSPALLEPSAASRALQEETAAACPNSPLWTDCVADARVAAKRSYVAEPADLYLGESDRFDPFSPQGWRRTAVTVAAVLVAAAAITVLAGRRLVRPIRMLTTAARRWASGDRAARVPLRGNDEVTRLADAFNTMADSVEHTERQREALFGDVAHELRTPLANVRGHLEAAQDGVVPLDPALVRSLIEESALLERLVADLADLALADAGMLPIHREERDAVDLAEQAVAAHRARAEESGVDIRLVAAGPVTVYADPVRLRQALGNLVSNAVRHTPGGSVAVAVGGSATEVTLTVADTGSGIAPEHLPHVFDRLYRADPSHGRATGGAGLGLAIARHLVDAHHGRIDVTSAPGAGSTFTIRLPRTGSGGSDDLEPG